MDLEPFVEAGLYDPASPNAAERLELIEHWLNRGFSVDAITALAQVSTPTSMAEALSNPWSHDLTLRDVAKKTGCDPALVMRVRRALGFAAVDIDEGNIPPTFVEAVEVFMLGAALYGEDRVVALGRVVGSSITSIVEASRAMFASAQNEAGATELEVSLANEVAIQAWEALIGLVGNVMRERTTRDEQFIADLLHDDVRVAVAFVDLVDSVSWAAHHTGQDQVAALTRFEAAAAEIAVAHGGRIVKFIGDEAMLVADRADAACRIAFDLCAFVAADPVLPAARGAVAFGPVHARDGDYFGEVVNLAARATKIASANTVVVSAAVVAALNPSTWTTSDLGAVAIRGIDTPVVLAELGCGRR
ncbi:MAG: hypothetical protein H0U92_10955 [Actinobacteria bacterium]|nr:hypothetical protein [Actinomycetota bacterium]